jgi:membrane protein DedA with SNARE-associated domain
VFVGFILVLDSVPVLGVLIPADVAVLAAVATRGPLGATAVVLAVVCGTLAGWTLTFTAGRFLSGPLRRSWLGRRIGADRWERAEELVARGGGRVVLAAPFLPIFNTIVPIAAGSLRMPYRRFLLYSAVGSAMWGAGYVTLGLVAQGVGDAVFGNSNVLTTMLFGLPGVAIGWVTLAQVRRRMAAGRERGAAPSGGRVVARVAATVPSQARATSSAARSSAPARRPRPVTSIARPVAARSGTSRPALTRLAVRRRLRSRLAHASCSPAAAPSTASSSIAAAASPSPPMLASACTMSLWLGLSYGGSGHPGEHDTAAEVNASGAAAASASTAPAGLSSHRHTTAQRVGLPGAVLRTAVAGRSSPRPRSGTRTGRTVARIASAVASSPSAMAMAITPLRYRPRSGAPGAPASLTYP